MRIAFLGTPEFALPSLAALYDAGHDLLAVTQPDRPVGRRAVLTPPPVKVWAEARGIPVLQFEKIRAAEGVAALKSFAPELMVTAAFGQLLSRENLAIAPLGTVNVHGSLLPKYRGASPIQWAIINGETATGITTMQTDIGMDTGDILLQKRLAIGEDETYGALSERLAVLGAETLTETLELLAAGKLVRTPQNDADATVCRLLTKEHGRLRFDVPARNVHNLVRGTNPWPGAWAMLNGSPLKIWNSRAGAGVRRSGQIGTLSGSSKDGLFVQC
ncbi:MAG: methionyl-tRNA formyltransferase, partial [Clostridiales bacterium]|nr:methionyl-tRNA formyltransferase [Clostridiales bacterium]